MPNLIDMKKFSPYEMVIPSDVANAFLYASKYRKKFPKNGKYKLHQIEELICKHSFASYQYAKFVLGKRFPEGESKIAECPGSSYFYVVDILGKERWPLCEKHMLRSPSFACQYAINVIKGRWPEAESVIMSNEGSAKAYMDFLKENINDTGCEGQERKSS